MKLEKTMRKYENPELVSENKEPQRAYYIPVGEGAYQPLNGTWRFKYYERDFEEDYMEKPWGEIEEGFMTSGPPQAKTSASFRNKKRSQ